MTLSLNRAAQIIAIALIATVVTQILYVHFEVNGDPAIAYPIWRTEAYAFLAIGLAAFAFLRDMPIVAGGLIIGAIFNIIQTATGIALFNPVFSGGDAIAPLGGALVGFAFFFYHVAKVALAVSAIAIGGSGVERCERLAQNRGCLGRCHGPDRAAFEPGRNDRGTRSCANRRWFRHCSCVLPGVGYRGRQAGCGQVIPSSSVPSRQVEGRR